MTERDQIREKTEEAILRLRMKHKTYVKIAEVLGTSHHNVKRWRRDGQVSATFARKVEADIGITRYELRPDVFGPPPKKTALAKMHPEAHAA